MTSATAPGVSPSAIGAEVRLGLAARENVQTKGRRYLLEGRLSILRVDSDGVRATCKGQGEVYRLWYTPREGWRCTCPAKGLCAHLVAAQLVVTTEVAS